MRVAHRVPGCRPTIYKPGVTLPRPRDGVGPTGMVEQAAPLPGDVRRSHTLTIPLAADRARREVESKTTFFRPFGAPGGVQDAHAGFVCALAGWQDRSLTAHKRWYCARRKLNGPLMSADY